MRRAQAIAAAGVALASALSGGPAGAATRRMFSYDPADDATRHAAGALTFVFDQHLASTTAVSIKATEGQASAELRRAPGGLYAVSPINQGAELISALCPGSKSAWMAIPRLKANRDIQVQVLGDSPAGGQKHVCRTLAFTFHGEWRLPPGPSVVVQGQVHTHSFPN